MSRGRHEILVGDCLEVLSGLEAGTFHACMTSPPYYALRSYLPAGHPAKGREIGSEATPEAFIATMVSVFRGVKRVLRDDGFLWVNLGDSYANDEKWGGSTGGKHVKGLHGNTGVGRQKSSTGVSAGNQLLMPHRVALALQADGWVLRDTVVWAKRSPMPSSQNGWRYERCRVKVAGTKWDGGNAKNADTNDGNCNFDAFRPHLQAKWTSCPGCPKCEKTGGWVLRRGQGRTTTSHEYLFLFVKNNSYFWDMENCREAAATGTASDKSFRKNGKSNGRNKSVGLPPGAGPHGGIDNRGSASRIPRSVWTLSSEPTKYRHFATYPSELVRRCLMPLSPKGCCPACGAQWAPAVEAGKTQPEPEHRGGVRLEPGVAGNGTIGARWSKLSGQEQAAWKAEHGPKVISYRPTCDCVGEPKFAPPCLPEPLPPVPCRVLDPFSGTGTTGQTACFLGHDYVGIELNPEYAAFAEEWIAREPRWSLRKKVKSGRKAAKAGNGQKTLW